MRKAYVFLPYQIPGNDRLRDDRQMMHKMMKDTLRFLTIFLLFIYGGGCSHQPSDSVQVFIPSSSLLYQVVCTTNVFTLEPQETGSVICTFYGDSLPEQGEITFQCSSPNFISCSVKWKDERRIKVFVTARENAPNGDYAFTLTILRQQDIVGRIEFKVYIGTPEVTIKVYNPYSLSLHERFIPLTLHYPSYSMLVEVVSRFQNGVVQLGCDSPQGQTSCTFDSETLDLSQEQSTMGVVRTSLREGLHVLYFTVRKGTREYRSRSYELAIGSPDVQVEFTCDPVISIETLDPGPPPQGSVLCDVDVKQGVFVAPYFSCAFVEAGYGEPYCTVDSYFKILNAGESGRMRFYMSYETYQSPSQPIHILYTLFYPGFEKQIRFEVQFAR